MLNLLFVIFGKTLYNGVSSEEIIYSINREKNVEGHFILGCGSINSVDYYYFYTDGEYGKKISKVDVNSIEIIETDKCKPSLKDIVIEGSKKTFMFIPKDTMKQEFNL